MCRGNVQGSSSVRLALSICNGMDRHHPPQDATELVAKLRAHHYTAQTKPGQEQLCRVGAGCKSGRELRGWDVGPLVRCL